MKMRKTSPRLLCYLSAATLALSACSQNATKVRPTVPYTADNPTDRIPSSETQSRLFHYSKKGIRQVKIADTRRTKRVQYEYANLWERLFDNYALPDVRNQAVERELGWFVNHPTYLQRAQQRAEPFLYNIVQQIERQGVPGELALLPVVESAFQAQAVSPAKAAGIWQFIPTTGRHYGLKQNHSYDGRRDVYASTKAAIKYLKKLNRQFNGDWLLAVAAYNCGEGAVEKAIQRNIYRGLPTDFWSLDLPQETRAYVPRLLAVSRLFADADRFGVGLRYIPNEAVFKPVKISHQLDLALAADAADMSLDEFRAVNPGFKNTFADPEGPVRLFVPAHKSKTFKKELARLAGTQSDLLRKEFERTRSTTAEIMSASADRGPTGPAAYVPRTGEVRASESVSVPSRLTPPPSPRRDEPKPSPNPAAASKTYEIAYAQPALAPNPFQAPTAPARVDSDMQQLAPVEETPRASDSIDRYARALQEEQSPAEAFQPSAESVTEDQATELAPARSKRAAVRKPRQVAAPARPRHVARHDSSMPVMKKTVPREAKPAQKPPVSYKYSSERLQTKSSARDDKRQVAKSTNEPPKKLAKLTVASAAGSYKGPEPVKAKARENASATKPAAASAGGHSKGGESAKSKARENPSTNSTTQRSAGKNADSRKSDRILTAKADIARNKGRR